MQSPGVVSLSPAEIRQRIDDFSREYLRDKSPATVGTYRRSLNEFHRWAVARATPIALTAASVREYKHYLTGERGLHEVSVSTYLTALRRLCQYLMDIGQLRENPAKAVKGNRRPKEHSREVLTLPETERLVASLDPKSQIEKRDAAILFAMLFAGLSEIELIRANVGDLEQTLLGWYLRVQGKGRAAKDQQVPIDPPVMERIRVYLDTRGRIRPEDPLFVSHGHRSEGSRLNTRSVRSRINGYLSRAGIKRDGVTPHSLTHTAAILWLHGGLDVAEVKKRMRHGTIDTTMIYYRQQLAV